MLKADKIRSILKPQSGYTFNNGLFTHNGIAYKPDASAGGGLLGWIQSKLKSRGALYYSLLNLFSPVFASVSFRKNLDTLLHQFSRDHIIANIGSGPVRLKGRKDIINTDLYAFNEVDVIADADDLPFIDDCLDLAINTAMLEHTRDPTGIVEEMRRVLRPGGVLFCYVPFIVPFHAAPDDYYRWTISGCKQLFSHFTTRDVFIGAGPISGALWVCQECLAMLFSFGNKTMHDTLLLLLMTLTAPIKLLDYFLEKHPQAANISSGFVIICRK